MRPAAILAVLGALVLAAPAYGHRNGKAEPRVAAAIRGGSGLERDVVVRLTDADSREPITRADVRVTAEMSRPHAMRLAPWRLPGVGRGVYRARVRFAMPAEWTLRIAVGGRDVVPARGTIRVRVVRREAVATPVASGPLRALPTRLEDRLTDRDYLSMALLWLHSVSALGWIVGVLAMVLALSARPAVLAEGLRRAVRTAYLRWGAWAHWSLVLVIVSTGVYNLFWVSPFPIRWGPNGVRKLGEEPYGALYEAILVVKLGLFAALLVTGTQVLLRTLRTSDRAVDTHSSGVRSLAAALGVPGIVYLAAVPLIVAAAMALRYVHVLNHVARVVEAG
jgi:hypothetical protein